MTLTDTLMTWVKQQDIWFNFILPVKLQKDAYIERYNRTVRYGWLGQRLFSLLNKLQEYAINWQFFYHHQRSNMALNVFTLMQHIQCMV